MLKHCMRFVMTEKHFVVTEKHLLIWSETGDEHVATGMP